MYSRKGRAPEAVREHDQKGQGRANNIYFNNERGRQMTTEEIEDAMDSITVYEARMLQITSRLVTITGNGHVIALCDESRAKEFEERRAENGY